MTLIKNPHLVPEGEDTMVLELLQDDQENITLNVAELISLKEVIKGAGAFAMRDIDINHVELLTCTGPNFWPPISVTKTNRGYVYYDGQHRLQAAKMLKQPTIRANSRTFENINELIEAAFRANLRHGLPASPETRGDYCYWLSLTFPDLSQRQIAARVGISQPSVARAIERRKKMLEAAIQETKLEEGGKPENEEDMEQWVGGVVKRVKTFVRSLSKVSETARDTENYTGLIRGLQFELLQVPEDRQALLFIGQLLLDAANRGKRSR